MLRLIKSNLRNFNNMIDYYNFKGGKVNKKFIINKTYNINSKLKIFSTFNSNKNSTR